MIVLAAMPYFAIGIFCICAFSIIVGFGAIGGAGMASRQEEMEARRLRCPRCSTPLNDDHETAIQAIRTGRCPECGVRLHEYEGRRVSS